MYSNKKNLLQLTDLLLGHGITDVVISPGSRNAPAAETWSRHPAFRCFAVTDERSAAFFALGLILQSHRPAAVCCTSGTALLNYGPAIAEAFYQQLPLLVLSADRPQAWIGQRDGQTLPQTELFGSLLKRSVQLPEPTDETQTWHCNRLINEALLTLTQPAPGPVQINIPLSEPLFDFSAETVPAQRVVRRLPVQAIPDREALLRAWNEHAKRMIVVGQRLPDDATNRLLRQLHEEQGCVVVAEQLANLPKETGIVENFDELLYTVPETERAALAPDLLVTFGGHIVSKRLKQLLRNHPPRAHWHIAPEGAVYDTYRAFTLSVPCEPETALAALTEGEAGADAFAARWQELSLATGRRAAAAGDALAYSDLAAVRRLLERMPAGHALFLGNSSTVRNAQLFSTARGTTLFCNRGTSGIEGSLSTAVGYAAACDRNVFVVLGDLSFFYDANGLWNRYAGKRLRILLVNNGTGGVFHRLPGLNRTDGLNDFIAAGHATEASGWAQTTGIAYRAVRNEAALDEAIAFLTDGSSDESRLAELFTDAERDSRLYRDYYHALNA